MENNINNGICIFDNKNSKLYVPCNGGQVVNNIESLIQAEDLIAELCEEGFLPHDVIINICSLIEKVL